MSGTQAKLLILLLPACLATDSGRLMARQMLHPNKRPRVIDLRENDVTTIMGYRAHLRGALTHPPMPEPYHYKEALVFGFTTPEDVMTWTVRSPREARYVVSLVYSGQDDVLAGCEVELASGESRIRMKPKLHDWEGKPFFIRHLFEDELPLVKGENGISLRLSKTPPDLLRSAAADREQAKKRLLRTQGFGVWSIELGTLDARKRQLQRARKLRSDNSWMVEGKYGLFIHWSTHALPLYGDKPRYRWHEKSVEMFDVDAFADAVQETGAAWVCLTATHGEHYWPGPSKVIDGILPGRTASRDLITDLAGALNERGIRLMLYYHWCVHSAHNEAWARAVGAWGEDPSRWFDNMEALFREVSLRYKDEIEGIGYMDDCGFIVYQYDPPWERWARAIKAGNPNALIGYSPSWGPSVSPFNELEITDGGGDLRPPTPDHMIGETAQHGNVLPARWFYIDGWVSRTPHNGRIGPGPRHSTEDYVPYFRKMAEAGVPLTVNLQITADVKRGQPFFNPQSMEVMRAVRLAVRE